MQLGTAAWLGSASHVLRQFQVGDFWIGQKDGYVGFRDDRHVLLVSGTRGGKGTSVLIPNLCMWPGSAVVIDPKGENAIVTARRRAGGSAWSNGMGQKVRILDPFTVVKTPQDGFDQLKASFNPLDELDVTKEESVDTAFRIADALVISEKSNDPFWDDSAKDLLSALLLHVASAKSFTAAERNLGQVCELVTAGDEKLARMAALASPDKKTPSGHWFLFMAMKGNTAFDGVVARAGSIFADLEESSPRTFASVVQVLRSNLKFLESPAMKRITRASNFRLSDVKTDAKGVTLYLCLPQRFMESHARWLRMMTTLLLNEMERTEQQPACGYPVLAVLDEFPALQRMRSLENAAAQIAGYGVKLVFVTQTLAQLKDIYKDNWETLLANAGVKLFFCNDDHFTRDYVSKLIGDCEVQRFSESDSETRGVSSSQAWGRTSGWSQGSSYSASNGNGSFGWNNSKSGGASFTHTTGTSHSQTKAQSSSVHKRPLVTPDEIGRLFGNRSNPKALVLVSGHQPISVDRVFYHRSPVFRGSFDWHPDHPQPLRHGELTLEETMAQVMGLPHVDARRATPRAVAVPRVAHPKPKLAVYLARLSERYHTLWW
jgi:type IV secretory pathway TraG/TraD family ATPase VirD4